MTNDKDQAKLEAVGAAADNLSIEIRDMDRDQIKELRRLGLDPATTEMTGPKNSEMIDWILDTIYSDVDFKGVPYYKQIKLATDTYKKAYGGPEAIKN